ncbi:unnamed protein product [Ilex paraguariensis]|uniref:DUF7788 domain-containing protein n=1 Tax=Ilex paraguariensis TaxID=185542 RepID=A0ABC8SVY7_9AQUA
MLPHEIIASLKDGDGGKVAELQWARMLDDLKKKGTLTNCIAVCDVSGSMSGKPMELHEVTGDSLLEKANFARKMECGMNTDFQRVFDKILEVAVDGNLSEDKMIKTIFVFSDMEFDEASSRGVYDSDLDMCSNFLSPKSDSVMEEEQTWAPRLGYTGRKMKNRPKGWTTDYEVIETKFRVKGFNKVPEIVFCNLRYSPSTPVLAKRRGVAMVSGFSKNMVKIFLEEGGIVNPEAVMEQAISGELYQKLVVFD